MGELITLQGRRPLPKPANGNSYVGWKDNRFDPMVIFAIDAASNGINGERASKAADQFISWCFTVGLPCKRLEGRWNGEQEISFIMHEATFTGWGVAYTWCKGQRSFLRLSPTIAATLDPDCGFRVAVLCTMINGELKPFCDLGRWHSVTAEEALLHDSWTYDPHGITHLKGPHAGVYWVAEHMDEVRAAAGESATA